MDHRRHHSVDSPTSPLSRAGSGHVRSPLSQLRAQATQEAILNALDGPSEKPLPFPPFEPLLFKTPFRNRSTRATVPVHVTPGSLKSHAASFENESEGSSDETVCESYATARGSAAPLSRTWSSPDIEWPAVKESTSEARTPPSQTTAPSPAPSDAGPSRAIRPPRRPTIATPPVANVVAPTPVSLSPLTPTSRPAPLSIIGLPLTEEAPVLPRSEPSPLRRQHAISRRPSPTQMGHTNSQAHSVAHSAPCHTHSVSLSSIPTLSSLLRNAGLHVEAMSRPTVSNSPHSGSHQSLPPPPPRLPSTRRHSDTTLGRRSQAPSASAASPARLDSFPPLLTPVANTTRVAATYTHVLLRASAFAQHLTDRSVKSATVRAMLAFLHGQPDDPAQLASLLDRLGDALVGESRRGGSDGRGPHRGRRHRPAGTPALPPLNVPRLRRAPHHDLYEPVHVHVVWRGQTLGVDELGGAAHRRLCRRRALHLGELPHVRGYVTRQALGAGRACAPPPHPSGRICAGDHVRSHGARAMGVGWGDGPCRGGIGGHCDAGWVDTVPGTGAGAGGPCPARPGLLCVVREGLMIYYICIHVSREEAADGTSAN
ncbi:unnamed protein product [Cutaneotrichosporon oleaginosum]